MTTKLEKEYEVLRNDLIPRSLGTPLRQISHALDTNKNGVWRELRNLGLLHQQRLEMHGIKLDAELTFCIGILDRCTCD